MKRTHDQTCTSQRRPASPGGPIASLRHTARLEHFAQLLEEERAKKQRLEWYLQEVLLERETLTAESSGYAASVLPTLNRYLVGAVVPTPTQPSLAASTVAPPTTGSTSAPGGGESMTCGSCGRLPFGHGDAACRCYSFESVRKRQRRLSLFVRTGTVLDTEESALGSSSFMSFGSAVERSSLVVPDDVEATTTITIDINNQVPLVGVTNQSTQAQRQGDDSEDEREEERAQESENSEEDEDETKSEPNSSINRTRGFALRRGDTKHQREHSFSSAAKRRLSVSHFFSNDALSSFPSV
jgi:hypothetical protein